MNKTLTLLTVNNFYSRHLEWTTFGARKWNKKENYSPHTETWKGETSKTRGHEVLHLRIYVLVWFMCTCAAAAVALS